MNDAPTLTGTSPVLPAPDIAATVQFYEQTLGFRPRVHEEEFDILERDGVEIHFWKCADVQIAANSRCRLTVKNVDAFYETCRAAGILHPDYPLERKPWGVREFVALDLNGCLLRILEREEAPPPDQVLEVHFSPYVFAGTRFPTGSLADPARVEEDPL